MDKLTQNKTATKTATNKNKALQSIDLQGFMLIKVIRIGFEPMTPSLEGWCSIQLSYRTSCWNYCDVNHRFFINSLPEPDFKYTSLLRASSRVS